MKRALPPLSSLRAFEAAARHRSFKHAAEELSLTPTAISHQVRALETHLELRLFDRHTRQVTLTEAGQHLGAVLQDSFDRIAEALVSIKPRRPTVTLSTTPAFAAQWLLPRWGTFTTMHPGIELRLHASNALADLASGAADIAVRYGRGHYPGMKATELMADRFLPMASPRLGLRRTSDLARHPLIHFEWHRPDRGHPSWPLWLRQAGLRLPSRGGLRFTEESHAIQAAVAGQGVALLSEVLVRDEVSRGLLSSPFGPSLPGMAYYLVWPDASDSKQDVEDVKAWILQAGASTTCHP